MTEPNGPGPFTCAIPSLLGFLERTSRITDPRQFSFDLISAIDELLLLCKPRRSFQFSEDQRLTVRRFAHRAFEAGRPLQLQHCGPEAIERGLRALVGLVNVLTLPEKEWSDPDHRRRERAFMTAVKRLRHAVYAAQLAIDEEWTGADVKLPPLSDQRRPTDPTATVLPFQSEARGARRADEEAVLWKRAESCFLDAQSGDDSAMSYASGLRLLSEGLVADLTLSLSDRRSIDLAVLVAQGALRRGFVPAYLSEQAFSALRNCTQHILAALASNAIERTSWPPGRVTWLCAYANLQANAAASAAYSRTFERAEFSPHGISEQQVG